MAKLTLIGPRNNIIVSISGRKIALVKPSSLSPITDQMLKFFNKFGFEKKYMNKGERSITMDTLKNLFLIVVGWSRFSSEFQIYKLKSNQNCHQLFKQFKSIITNSPGYI